MPCIYGNSSWYIDSGPLYRGGPLLGGSIIRGSTVFQRVALLLLILGQIYTMHITI